MLGTRVLLKTVTTRKTTCFKENRGIISALLGISYSKDGANQIVFQDLGQEMKWALGFLWTNVVKDAVCSS